MGEIVKAFDQGHKLGHECGYRDAVTEVWSYIYNMPDAQRAKFNELANWLREREAQVLGHSTYES